MRHKAMIGLWCIFLIIMLPFAAAQELSDNAPELSLTASIPNVIKDIVLDISGTTLAGASVELLINGETRRIINTVEDTGNFTFFNVALPEERNTLMLIARHSGREARIEREVIVDRMPPKLVLTLPEMFTEGATINGTVDEPVTLRYRIRPADDTTPPAAPRGLRNGSIEPNTITLRWQTAKADLKGYLLYRDGSLIQAINAPPAEDSIVTAIDNLAVPDATHTYAVSAVDQACNEGPKSNTLRVRSAADGGAPAVAIASLQEIGCGFEEQQLRAGAFTLSLPLPDNQVSIIDFIAEDRAGHQTTLTATTLLDTQPPVFLSHNLDSLSPAYRPQVEIKGQLSEQGTVFVFINNDKKPAAFGRTDRDGRFAIKAALRRDVEVTSSTRSISMESGVGWDNTIRLEAVDAAGHKTELPETIVRYALCGFGSTFRVDLGQITPSVLNPRLLLQNVQQAGIPFNISYRGSALQHFVNPNQIRVRTLQLSGDTADRYDNEWVVPNVLVEERGDDLIGFIQIDFSHVPEPQFRKNITLYDKEANISANHRGECGELTLSPIGAGGEQTPGLPGIGCVKLFLEMEIPYQEIFAPGRAMDPRVALRAGSLIEQVFNDVQTVCIPVSIAIDQRIPPDILPNGLLTAAVELLDSAIDVIDGIVKPLTTIGTYILYGCMGGSMWLYAQDIQERFACEGQEILSIFTGTGFDKRIAQAGLCEEVFASDDAKRDACMRCQSTIKARKEFETGTYHQVCDRVACPSAPSLQTHIKDMAGDVEPLAIKTLPPDVLDKWGFAGQVWSGSDCAFSAYADENKNAVKGPLAVNFKGIKDVYDKFHEGPDQNGGTLTKADCQQLLRPAHPDCCGFEYMREWGTACGVSSGEDDLFDEIKESTCLAAQKAGVPEKGPKCNVLWNSMAGFCEPGSGRELPKIVGPFRGLQFKDKPVSSARQDIYLRIMPIFNGEEIADYALEFGMVYEQFRLSGGDKANPLVTKKAPRRDERFKPGQKSMVNAQLLFTPVSPQAFRLREAVSKEQKPQQFCEDQSSAKRIQEMCENDLRDQIKNAGQVCRNRANEIWKDVCAKIGVSDKEYIVIPESGLLRSTQCVCIPAVTSYLQLWRTIMIAGRNCLQKILYTGDGSPGVCQAALSRYACDLLFELVSCFTQKYGSAGGGKRVSAGPFGDIIGALTGAGQDVANSVRNRYGSTALYKTMFSERKLVHAACMFAFTGEWNLDVSGIFQQTVESIPIESQGLMFPCERRFVSYNPLSNPSGLATWNYHFGTFLAAGADLRYELKLECSPGFRCDPSDGFKGGECDCNKKKRDALFVNTPDFGTGQMRKNDVLNTEVFYTVQSDVRYDKATLRWEYDDKKTDKVVSGETSCNVQLAGGDAPAFCAFDPFTLSYRCRFGSQKSGVSLKRVRPLYPESLPAFPKQEPLAFAVDIKQKMPDRPKPQDDKFLGYRIIDGTGDEVLSYLPENDTYTSIDPYGNNLALRTDGDFSVDIEIPPDAIPDLEKRISRGTRPIRQLVTVAKRWSPALNGRVVTDTKTIKSAVAKILNTDKTVSRMYVLEFPNQDEMVYNIYRTEQVAKANAQTGMPKNEIIDEMITLPPSQLIEFRDVVETPDHAPVTYDVKIQLARRPIFQEGDAPLQFHITTQRPTAPKTAAEDACAKGDMVPWRIEFLTYDADTFGTPSKQQSTDAIIGRAAQKRATFLITCLDTAALRQKRGQEAPLDDIEIRPAPPPGDDITIAKSPTGQAIIHPCEGACSKIGCIGGSVRSAGWCPQDRDCCVFP